MREETGYQIEPVWLTSVYNNMPRGVISLVFLARVVGGERSTSAETSHVEWWTPEQVSRHFEEPTRYGSWTHWHQAGPSAYGCTTDTAS